MLPILQHQFRFAGSRPNMLAAAFRRFSTTNRGLKPQVKAASPFKKKKQILLAAAGVGVASVTLLFCPPETTNVKGTDDALDTAELSKVPFRKLLSGWV